MNKARKEEQDVLDLDACRHFGNTNIDLVNETAFGSHSS